MKEGTLLIISMRTNAGIDRDYSKASIQWMEQTNKYKNRAA